MQEANDAFEVNYISFILFCCVQCDLSYPDIISDIILRDLQYLAPQLSMERLQPSEAMAYSTAKVVCLCAYKPSG